MSIENILPLLHKVRRTQRGRWQACCPAHEDKGPSLALRELDDGRVLLHCFAGCAAGDIVGALGLELGDLFPPPSGPQGQRRERQPFGPLEALRCVGYEALLVLISAANLLAGLPFSEGEMDRLALAVGRIQGALETVGVRHEC